MCNERVNDVSKLGESQCCGAKVIKVHKPWHICMFLMNFAEPGSGTFFNACCCHADASEGLHFANIIYAWVQSVFSALIIGWIWSMNFGVMIWKKSD